jgi:DNA-binding PucR family transcriptional regulator
VILDTVRRYLANDRRLNETAAELHTHVNTIRNRLARFEQLTGRDLHHTEDLVETWWVLHRAR